MVNDLWREFNLREKNKDPGGGLLYCLRYSSARLQSYQTATITALKSLEVTLEEKDEVLLSSLPKDSSPSIQRRAYALLEELSVVNEALEYGRVGYGQFQSIPHLANSLMVQYLELLQDRNIVDAYNLVDMVMPQIVRDLAEADRQNDLLSTKERQTLEKLRCFSQKQVRNLDSPGGIVMLG